MAVGEKSFSTSSVEKTKRNFDPVKQGDWDLKLLKQVDIRTAEPKKILKGPNKGQMSKPLPRVSIRFEILESAVDGGKNKLYFHDLYTSLVPDNGGVIAATGADQLKGLADALGSEADIPMVLYTPKGTTEKVKCLDARALKAWVESNADAVVRAHLRIQAGTPDYPEAKNKLTEFFDAGAGGTSDGDSAEGGDDALPDADEALDELPEMEEEKPAARKPAPAKGKPVQKKR